jgi:hypothetical protein
MNIYIKLFSAFIITVLVFTGSPAFAEEVSTDQDTAVSSDSVTPSVTQPPKPRPMMMPFVQKPPVNAVEKRLPAGAVCPQIYAPVCGVDGVTYGNDCEAKSANVQIARRGACGEESLRPIPPVNLIKQRMASTAPRMPETVRQNVKDRVEDKVKNSIKRATQLILATAERLETLLARIESRADKLDAEGVDTTSARADLDAAQAEIDAAESDIASITPVAVQVLSSRTLAAVSDAVLSSRAAFESARNHLKNAQEYMRSAVKKLSEAAKAAGLGQPPASGNAEPQN